MTLHLRLTWLRLLLPGCIAALAWGSEPAVSLKDVTKTRDGLPIGNRLCVVYSAQYQINLAGFETAHSFDIHKYAKIYRQLVADQVVEPAELYVPAEISNSDLRRVHSREYLRSLNDPKQLAACLEAPLVEWLPASVADRGLLRAFRHSTGGTLLAARQALQHGMAINLGGGYHHAGPDRGGGFCVYADMAIAIRALQAEKLVRRVLVVDLDVHQGDGTARCVAADDNVFTFDMHEQGIYPIPKQRNDLDVPLAAGTEDDEYLRTLAGHLPGIFDRARPELVVYQAGCDVLEDDPLANLRVTVEGLVRRDALVFEAAAARQTPIVMVLGGGYSQHAWEAQYQSVRNLIERFGGDDRMPASRPAR